MKRLALAFVLVVYPAIAVAQMDTAVLSRARQETQPLLATLKELVEIRSDPDWRNGEYIPQPRRALAAIEYGWIALFGDPLALMTAAPTRTQADRMLDARIEARQRGTDVNDTLYQLEASSDYNPAPDLGRIRARVFAANTEDDSVNPPYLGVMEPAIARIPAASYVVIPRSAGTAGHGSYSIGKLYTRFVADMLNRR